MNYYIFGLGIILLTFTTIDLIKTALSVNGAGFMSKRLSKGVWGLLLWYSNRSGRKKILEMAGALILTVIVLNWLLLIWASSSLLFISYPDSLMNVETNTTTDVISKIFFTGYTLSTLGLGDIEPIGPFWDVLTAVLSFAGLILISIALTYLIPVVSAEIQKRRISVYITTIGCSVEEILTNHWNGKDFKSLESIFDTLTQMIILHAQNHQAYSVLHFFHTSNRKEAFVLNITNLDEVLTILLFNVAEEQRPSRHIIMGLRSAISSYLITLPMAYIKPGKEVPPAFELKKLEQQGVKLNFGEEVTDLFAELNSRRRLLLSLIRDDGWEWADLEAGSYDHYINTFR